MIDKRALPALLAMVAMSAVSTPTTAQTVFVRSSSKDFESEERARRNYFDRQAARQKRIARSRQTEEHRTWNDAVDAKKAAKKATP